MPLKFLPICTTVHSFVEVCFHEPRRLERIYLTLGIIILIDLKFFGSMITNEMLKILIPTVALLTIIHAVVPLPRSQKLALPNSENVWIRKKSKYYYNEYTGRSTPFNFLIYPLLPLCHFYLVHFLPILFLSLNLSNVLILQTHFAGESTYYLFTDACLVFTFLLGLWFGRIFY